MFWSTQFRAEDDRCTVHSLRNLSQSDYPSDADWDDFVFRQWVKEYQFNRGKTEQKAMEAATDMMRSVPRASSKWTPDWLENRYGVRPTRIVNPNPTDVRQTAAFLGSISNGILDVTVKSTSPGTHAVAVRDGWIIDSMAKKGPRPNDGTSTWWSVNSALKIN
jgi:hypothetical protein